MVQARSSDIGYHYETSIVPFVLRASLTPGISGRARDVRCNDKAGLRAPLHAFVRLGHSVVLFAVTRSHSDELRNWTLFFLSGYHIDLCIGDFLEFADLLVPECRHG